MKKFLYLAALAVVALSANAQTKEELKALKEAQKEAEKVVKHARQTYEQSIPNAQYGRKETDFTKLADAKAMIEQALGNKYSADEAETYKVAADIAAQYYNKYDNAVKANMDDTEAKANLINTSKQLVGYAIKYDSLYNINPKKKDADYKTAHTYYQNLAVNPLIQCLQASQNYSTSDKQSELKDGAALGTLVVNAFTKSNLFSDFSNPSKDEWITYAKAFKAQSLASVEGASATDVENAYLELVGTKYESTAYSALCNYYRETNADKYIEYLKKGMEKSDAETWPNFAFMLMQYQFTNDKKDDCLNTIQQIKEKAPDNENTVNAYLMEGQIYFERKLYDKAEALFAEAVQKFPDDERAITMPAKSAWMKAQASGDKTDMQHAVDLFKELEAKYPNNTDYWGEPLYILYNNMGNIAARDKYKKYYTTR